HAKAANVPIIVAINKIDKPGANVNKVRESLMQYDLLPEEYGGTVMTVGVSAATRENLDKLLEAVILQSEIMELSALKTKNADGIILESRVDKNRGVVTSILVQNGILKQGDIIVLVLLVEKLELCLTTRESKLNRPNLLCLLKFLV
ncbi:MAG: translation initiation factor IF-2, partial [Chlamydiae bacterium]|nr:translation initiation factor IF-2 [Chlamydiota bacterium]